MESMEARYSLNEVRIRLAEGDVLYNTSPIQTSEDAVEMLKQLMVDADREYLYVVNLDTKGCPINYSLVAAGTVNAAAFRTADIFKSAILSNASSIVMLHNHPSGDPTPSDIDMAMTEQLVEAGKLLGIHLLDHVIIGGMNGSMYSFDRDRQRKPRRGVHGS